MLSALIFFVASVSSTLGFSPSEVLDVTVTVLIERQFLIREIVDGEFVTEKVEVDVDILNNYIVNDLPDDNSGWTKARVFLCIKAFDINYGQTEIIIEAFFERYGTRSALMLIPPTWVPVSSNGLLEKEILLEIENRLTTSRGGIQ